MPGTETTWGASLRQTWRLLPTPSGHLRPFLEAEGLTPQELLRHLPYDHARTSTPGALPDPKRYRDPKQVYQTIGMLYEGDDGLVHVTALGQTTLRWLDIINDKNAMVLGRHAAFALSTCQLRNPSDAGEKYHSSVEVFPFTFIWRAMLGLEGKLSSDELNRAILTVRNTKELEEATARIKRARAADDPNLLGPETVSGTAKNDRLIPWMAMASFGWTLFSDKVGGFYRVTPRQAAVLEDATRVYRRHREFGSVKEYVEHISRAAALPKDMR